MATTRRHQSVEKADRQANEPGHEAPEAPQGPVTQLLALQQVVGNAAVSRLIARSRSLNRAGDGGAGKRAADDAPGGGQDAMLSMMRVAWDTGVTQRERDAAKKLEKPGGKKDDFADAQNQIVEAMNAGNQIGAQIGTVDPNREVRTHNHTNVLNELQAPIIMLQTHTGPADVGEHIDSAIIPNSEKIIADITAPLTAAAPGANTPGPAPSAPTPAPPAPSPGPP
jgi:hypothetical protein